MTFLVCALFLGMTASVLGGPSPPEKVLMTNMKPCKMDGKSAFRFNKNDDSVDIDLDLSAGLDDKVQLSFDLEAGGEGKWKSLMKSNGPACKTMNQYISPMIKRISKMFEPALPAKCPWRKGTYKLKGLSSKFELSDFNVPSIPTGLFKLTINIKEKSKVLFCTVIDATVKAV